MGWSLSGFAKLNWLRARVEKRSSEENETSIVSAEAAYMGFTIKMGISDITAFGVAESRDFEILWPGSCAPPKAGTPVIPAIPIIRY